MGRPVRSDLTLCRYEGKKKKKKKKKMEEKMEEVKEEEPEEEIVAEEVSLTEEDRQVRFIKKGMPDIPAEVSSAFAKFSLPDNDEGFDQIVYAWQPEDKCHDQMKQWQLNKKMTERV